MSSPQYVEISKSALLAIVDSALKSRFSRRLSPSWSLLTPNNVSFTRNHGPRSIFHVGTSDGSKKFRVEVITQDHLSDDQLEHERQKISTAAGAWILAHHPEGSASLTNYMPKIIAWDVTSRRNKLGFGWIIVEENDSLSLREFLGREGDIPQSVISDLARFLGQIADLSSKLLTHDRMCGIHTVSRSRDLDEYTPWLLTYQTGTLLHPSFLNPIQPTSVESIIENSFLEHQITVARAHVKSQLVSEQYRALRDISWRTLSGNSLFTKDVGNSQQRYVFGHLDISLDNIMVDTSGQFVELKGWEHSGVVPYWMEMANPTWLRQLKKTDSLTPSRHGLERHASNVSDEGYGSCPEGVDNVERLLETWRTIIFGDEKATSDMVARSIAWEMALTPLEKLGDACHLARQTIKQNLSKLDNVEATYDQDHTYTFAITSLALVAVSLITSIHIQGLAPLIVTFVVLGLTCVLSILRPHSPEDQPHNIVRGAPLHAVFEASAGWDRWLKLGEGKGRRVEEIMIKSSAGLPFPTRVLQHSAPGRKEMVEQDVPSIGSWWGLWVARKAGKFQDTGAPLMPCGSPWYGVLWEKL